MEEGRNMKKIVLITGASSDIGSGDIEILVDFEKRRIVRLKELIPDWWGKERFLVEE